MVLLYNMYAVLSAEIRSAAQFAEAARGWLTGALAEVYPALYDSVCADQDTGRPGTGRDPSVAGESRRQPGHVVGTLTVNPEDPVFDGRELDYSSRSWLRFLSDLGNYPAAVSVDLGLVDDHDDPLPGSAYIRAERDSESPEWASFMFTAGAEDTGWPESAQVQARCAEFVKTQAARIGAVWGGMTDDVAPRRRHCSVLPSIRSPGCQIHGRYCADTHGSRSWLPNSQGALAGPGYCKLPMPSAT